MFQSLPEAWDVELPGARLEQIDNSSGLHFSLIRRHSPPFYATSGCNVSSIPDGRRPARKNLPSSSPLRLTARNELGAAFCFFMSCLMS